jgi:hypothetical protein
MYVWAQMFVFLRIEVEAVDAYLMQQLFSDIGEGN